MFQILISEKKKNHLEKIKRNYQLICLFLFFYPKEPKKTTYNDIAIELIL